MILAESDKGKRNSEGRSSEIGLTLRSKICEKIASVLEEKYLLKSETAKKHADTIENKIYKQHSKSTNDYREGCKCICKCIDVKYSDISLNIDPFIRGVWSQ